MSTYSTIPAANQYDSMIFFIRQVREIPGKLEFIAPLAQIDNGQLTVDNCGISFGNDRNKSPKATP